MPTMPMLRSLGFVFVAAVLGCAPMKPAKPPHAAAPSPATRQFTFAWRYGVDDGSLAPRGGTSHGAAVTLDTKPCEAWEHLRAPGISTFERDRRAILAMAGAFRTSFDFLEIIGFRPGLQAGAAVPVVGDGIHLRGAGRAAADLPAAPARDVHGERRQGGRAVRHEALAARLALRGPGDCSRTGAGSPGAGRDRRHAKRKARGRRRSTKSTTRRATRRSGAGSISATSRPGGARRPGGRCRAASGRCGRTTTS